jgi:hypothetical protein
MILEHGLDDLTATYNTQRSAWDIGQRKIYRWCTNDNIPSSEWFTDIGDALEWIKNYDRTRNTTIL